MLDLGIQVAFRWLLYWEWSWFVCGEVRCTKQEVSHTFPHHFPYCKKSDWFLEGGRATSFTCMTWVSQEVIEPHRNIAMVWKHPVTDRNQIATTNLFVGVRVCFQILWNTGSCLGESQTICLPSTVHTREESLSQPHLETPGVKHETFCMQSRYSTHWAAAFP